MTQKVFNDESTSVLEIKEQMLEPRPLPMGRQAFEDFAERIIAGSMLPSDPNADQENFLISQKFALASMIMHLGPHESHKPDAHFIHGLRRAASNQVAQAIVTELNTAKNARFKVLEDARIEAARKEIAAERDAAEEKETLEKESQRKKVKSYFEALRNMDDEKLEQELYNLDVEVDELDLDEYAE